MNFDQFVGLPWRERGRDASGCDCWGLVRLVYAAELRVDLPSHSDDYVTTADLEATAALFRGGMSDWIEVTAGQERPFDVVLMRRWHVGLVATPGRWMLHQPVGGDSRMEPYRHGQQGRVTLFRHVSQGRA